MSADAPADADAEDASADADGAAVAGSTPEAPDWLSLDDGETIEWVGRPARVSLVPAILWGIVLTPVFGVGLVIMAVAYLTMTNTDFVVTSTTLYHKRGVLSTNIESVGLDRVQNTEYSQSFSGKQFGYGSIEVSTAGSSGADVTFRAIEDPQEVRDLVNRLVNAAGGGGGTSADRSGGEAGAAPAGVDAALLEELLDDLRAVNESMENVERLLRERQDGGGSESGGPSDSPADSVTGSGGADTGDGGGAGDGTGTDAGDDGSPSPFDDEG